MNASVNIRVNASVNISVKARVNISVSPSMSADRHTIERDRQTWLMGGNQALRELSMSPSGAHMRLNI